MNPVIRDNMLKLYRDYTYARADIYYQKEILKKPRKDWVYIDYAPDPLKDCFFTNVRRELDKGTKYLIDNIVESIKKDDNDYIKNSALNTVLYRATINCKTGWEKVIKSLFNKEYIDFNKNIDYIKIKNFSINKDDVISNNAYVLGGLKRVANLYFSYNGVNNKFGNYIAYVYSIRQQVFDAIFYLKDKNYEQSLQTLKNILGLGDFLAYQIYSDFCYILNDDKGLDTVISCGPGTKAGLDLMFLDKNKLSYEDLLRWFRDNVDILMKERNLDWDVKEFLHFLPTNKQIWDISSVANSFCEFKKLVNALYHNHKRRKYNGI